VLVLGGQSAPQALQVLSHEPTRKHELRRGLGAAFAATRTPFVYFVWVRGQNRWRYRAPAADMPDPAVTGPESPWVLFGAQPRLR